MGLHCGRYFVSILYLVSVAALGNEKPPCHLAETHRLLAVPKPPHIRPDLVSTVQTMLDTGPNRWIDLPHAASVKGQFRFQRGMSGGMDLWHEPDEGVREALSLLEGHPTITTNDVSQVSNIESSEYMMRTINSSYSRPMAYRARGDRGHLTLSDSRLGAKEGLTIDSVEAVGLFPPAEDTVITSYTVWARNYLLFCDRLSEVGLRPTPGSRGARFLGAIRDVLKDNKGDSAGLESKLAEIVHSYP